MTNTKLRVQKLRLLEEEFGSLEYLLEEAIFNGVDMGICMNPECDYTTTVEPDSDSGYCEECDSNTVESTCMLAGII